MVKYSKLMKIGFQGVPGAYSEMAARKFFGKSDLEYIGLRNFEDIFKDVYEDSLDFGMIPIENSLAGSIHKSIDLLNKYDLRIIGEVYLRVEHNLLGVPGANIRDIKEIYSHWQALAQCEDTIKNLLPEASVKEYFDTAGSAEYVAKESDPSKGAIASKLASEIYGLSVIKENVEDNKNNYTRFVVINKKYADLENSSTNKYKTSITFSGNSVPGFLYSILKSFAIRNINLTKIESRPIPEKTWGYFFYIDFEGRFNDPDCEQALKEAIKITPDLKVLGSYKADN